MGRTLVHAKGINPLKFSIVTAVYNQIEYTQLFLQSIKENSSQPYELIVVDNGSDDPTKSWLRQQKCKLIRWEENQGTTKAWNAGIKAARGEYVCVINNDVIVSPKWLEGLLKTLLNAPEDLGVLSPSTNEVTYNLNISPNNEGYKIFKQESLHMQSQKEVLWQDSLVGAGMVLTRKLINKIGLFDERYFAYYNDLDYLLALVSAGFKSYTTNQSMIYHFGGASGKNNPIIAAKKEEDKEKFLSKWSQLRNFLNQYYFQLQ